MGPHSTRLACGFLMLAACGNDFAEKEMAAATCERYAECCADWEFFDTTGTSNEDLCREAHSNWSSRVIPALEESIEAGRVQYHPLEHWRCKGELASMSCVEAMAFLRDGGLWWNCPDAFDGQVPIGGACTTPWDCTSVHCAGVSFDLTGRPMGFGVCAELPTVGMECPDYRCADGAYCDDALICQELLPAGSTCYRDWQCESDTCTSDDICGERTRCDGR